LMVTSVGICSRRSKEYDFEGVFCVVLNRALISGFLYELLEDNVFEGV